MSEQPYMQLWVADFLGDTLHLSDAEIGQYMLLLLAMWRNGGYLPDEPKKLARIARNPVSEDVMALFSKCEANASICQKRLLAELEKARAKSEARSAAGKAGAEAKALKNKKRPKAKAKAKAPANDEQTDQQSSSILHSQLDTTVSNKSADAPSSPREMLLTVLDEEHAEAVIQHRVKKRSALMPHTAKLLVNQLSKCPDPNAAADEMMLRGWTSVKPDWLENKARDGPQAARPNGEGWVIPWGTREYTAWRDHFAKENSKRLYDFPKDPPHEGFEAKAPCRWPSGLRG